MKRDRKRYLEREKRERERKKRERKKRKREPRNVNHASWNKENDREEVSS